MPQNRPCDVTPTSEQDKYSVAFQDESGRWYGIDAPLNNIIPRTLDVPEPLTRVGFNTYHSGRGFDKFSPNQNGYMDGMNLWSTTPGKAHATQLFRWAKGLRDAVFNMPNANGVTWKPLVGTTRYLDVTFVPDASFTAAKLILLIRRRVPAGTVGVPGTLTAEICSNSGGFPSTVLETATVTSSDITDVVSEYYTWTISEALTASTTYHLKVYGASTDKDGACWEIAVDPSAAGLRSSVNTSWSSNAVATTYSPYYRITDADTRRYFKQFVWDDALYAVAIHENLSTASKLYINGVRGRATSGSTTTITDTGHGTYGATAWPTNRFTDAYVRVIRGTGQGQIMRITSNTGDTLSFNAQLVAFDSTSEYIVFATDWFVEIGSTGLGVVTSDPCIQNGTVYFPQGDSTNMRIMHLDYTDADDHAWDVENTNNNKAYHVEAGYDAVQGPQVWRANVTAATGTPNSAAISVSRASTSPLSGGVPTPVAFGTDLTFGRSIPCGDNTNKINGIIFHDNVLHVLKDDGIFIVQNDIAVQLKVGTERAPRRTNGLASAVGSDKQLYIGFLGDVYLLTGGGAYSTRLRNNMPSNRVSYVSGLAAGEGWIFAAVNASTIGYSSVMKYSLDTQTWSEQWRSFFLGRRVMGVAWQDCPETRPRLWIDVGGELVYQEFPLNGVRPYDDSGQKYQHEAVMVLPTIDMLSTDPKYYATLTVTSQGLATDADTESGHELIVEYQTDNDVGSTNWLHAGYIRNSPSGSVEIGVGNTQMLRPRLRLISNEALDPVIVETVSLTLFARSQLSHQWQIFFKQIGRAHV